MYDVLLVIQYVNLVIIFGEAAIIFKNWRNYLHGWLLMNCIVQLVNAAGLLVEYQSHTEAAYLSALRLSYLGRIWVALFMFLFVAELCGKKIPIVPKLILLAIHAGIYVTVFTMPDCKLYYTKYVFYRQGGFSHFAHTNGITHHIYTVLQVCYIIAGVSLLIVSLCREKNRQAKKRLRMVLCAVAAMSLFYLVQISGLFSEITHVFDVTMIGYTICNIFMYIAILRFDLLGMREAARDVMIDRLSEGVIAVDNNGTVQYFNEPAKSIYPDLAVSAGKVPSEITEALSTGGTIMINDRIFKPEENELIRGKERFGTLYALVDETEHFHYMEVLEEQKQIADSANKAKSAFLASMSHEIRTPINAVLGMDEMILRESSENEIINYAEDIRIAGRTLLSLINDILDFSKIEEGRMEIIPAQYELGSLINDLVNMVQSRADDKGLRFGVSVDGNIPHLLCGDEIRIKQCALNILTNAVKYTEKGSVDFTVGYEEKDSSHILLKFTVKDTGIGMKPEDIEKLFSPFERIEEYRNRGIEGTGLGMSITKQLLVLMDSKLDVSSVYGEGSEFSFAVLQEVVKNEPIGDYAERYRAETAQGKYREMFRAPDAKILAVDDTPVNLAVIKGLLKKTLVHIDTAASGKEALAFAAGTKYDIIFIDHMMPDMDGIETLHRLRELPANKDTTCVALTANAISGAREMYIEAGFDEYLTKPVDGERLEKMLLSYLPEEKLETVSEEEPGGDEEETELPGQLYSIGEIDVESGIRHCGNAETYLGTLSVYESTAQSNADEIENYWKTGDIANATIKIHALKSTSRAIGADDLGALAEKLEMAGKANDTEVLGAHIEDLIARYRALGSALSGLFGGSESDDDKPLIPEDMLRKSYEAIREFSENFDIDGAALAIEAIAKYKLPGTEREKFSRLKKAADEFDWDTVAEIAGGQ